MRKIIGREGCVANTAGKKGSHRIVLANTAIQAGPSDVSQCKMCQNTSIFNRPVDSAGGTVEFMFSPKRHLARRNLFLRLALYALRSARPRVINVDGHPVYGSAITEIKQSGELRRRCRRST
jgi:hypothetical protein